MSLLFLKSIILFQYIEEVVVTQYKKDRKNFFDIVTRYFLEVNYGKEFY